MCLHSKIFFTNGFLGSKPAKHKKTKSRTLSEIQHGLLLKVHKYMYLKMTFSYSEDLLYSVNANLAFFGGKKLERN